MKTQQTHHPVHKEVIVGLALLVLLAVGGGAWWAWQSTKPEPVSKQSIPSKVKKAPTSQTQPTAIPAPVIKTAPQGIATITQLKPQAYWLQVKENGDIALVPQQVTLQPGVSQEVALKTAVNNLLSVPSSSELSSTIPQGTRLLSLRVTKSGIYVNLSQKFSSGGGSTSMIYRVAQILYTVSSLDSNAKVYLSVEGKLLDEDNPLGGEGILLPEPLTRQQFAQDFSISTS